MRRAFGIPLILTMALSLLSCQAEVSDETTAVSSVPAASIQTEEEPKAINAYFTDPPPAEERDAARPLEPTDIVSFMCFEPGPGGAPVVAAPLLRCHVSVFCPGFYGLNDDGPNMNNTRICAERGIGIVNWLSVGDLESAELSDVPDIVNAQCEDIDGNMMPYHVGGGKPTQCTNNPIWQQVLIDQAVTAARCGALAVSADEWPGSCDAVVYGGCFCPECMAGFRAYLAENADPEDLRALGITDLTSFDYGDFIRENYYDAFKALIARTSYEYVPLMEEFREYQYRSVTAFMHMLREKIAETDPDVYFSANMADLMSTFMGVADIADFFCPELMYAYPINARTAVRYELGNAFDAPVNAAPNCMGNKELMTGDNATEIMKIYTAEAYAHGGYVQVPYQAPYVSGLYGDDSDMTSTDMEVLYPYYDYIHNHPELFTRLWPMADVGVLYSYASIRQYTGGGEDDFFGCAQTLIEHNIPCRVVATGDGVLIHKQLTDQDLYGLKLLILPSVLVMSETDVGVLQRFVEKGGQIMELNNTAWVDESGTRLDTLLGKNPRYIYFPQIVHWQEENLQMTEPADIDEFIDGITKRVVPRFSIDDTNILGTMYFSTELSGYVLHLVNYAFDETHDKVAARQEVNVRIQNDTPFTPEEMSVLYGAPEEGGLEPVAHTVMDEMICVTLPAIDAWGTIVIREGD